MSIPYLSCFIPASKLIKSDSSIYRRNSYTWNKQVKNARSSKFRKHNLICAQLQYEDEPVVITFSPPTQLDQHKIITHKFRSSLQPAELLRQIQKYQKQMNGINTSSAASTAAHFLKPGRRLKYRAQMDILLQAYKKLYDIILDNCADMKALEVCNCLYALGKAADAFQFDQKQKKFNQVFMALCKRLEFVRNEMEGQQISNVLWAMAKVKWRQKDHFNLVVIRGTELDDDSYTTQAIANILWAIAKYEINDINTIQYFVRLVKLNVERLLPFDISSVLCSLRNLRYLDKALMDQLEQLIIKEIHQFDSHSICMAALTFSDFGLERRNQIINLLAQKFINTKYRNAQDISNFIYALSILGTPPENVQLLIDYLFQNNQSLLDQFSTEALRQFRRVQLQYVSQQQKIYLPPQFEKICALTNKKAVFDERNFRNQFREAVFAQIKQHFPNARKGISALNGEVPIDIEIKNKFQRIALQTCSFSCFTSTEPPTLLGGVLSYFQLVKGLGWKVIVVSELEWGSMVYQQIIIELIQQELEIQNKI
eukprot:TRINITY_DN8996_c0_g1_i3.p1 TRINITY_DN8996_c0_g1~~TRINITY_DN8996_c0_g1_i3.p1  ORF type:complete len:540 (-),score=31.84 TRINITY_DN8996_c0_g1_i3:187-1806(-)